MNIYERIKEIRQHFCEGSNVKFAEIMGESPNTTSGWVSGKRGIGNTVIQKIINKFPTVSLEWLMTGGGSMLKHGVDGKDNAISNSTIIGEYNTNELAQVPFVSIAATASFVETFCDETLIKETVGIEGYTQEEISRYGYIVIEVSGCSMEPTIMNKARILCKRVSPSDWEYFSKGIYVVGYGRDMLVVKRVKHNDLLEKGTLTLYSDNVEYGELTIPKSAIRCIWKGLEIVKQKLL